MSDKDKPITQLTLDEVLQILNLIEKSDFDFLQLEAGDLKLTVGKQGFQFSGDSGSQSAPTPAKADAKTPDKEKMPAPGPSKAPAAKEGTVPIVAPMVGTFYTTPEPGAPPFINMGDAVDPEATVGLIEVMKVFNAVTSKVKGVIAEVCVENGQFVEYGQTLFFVRPDGK